MLTRKYDGRKVIHTKFGEGIINSVNISSTGVKVGVDFTEDDCTVFRIFTIKIFKFYLMIFKGVIKI